MIQLVRPHRGPITQQYANIQPDGNPHTGQDYGYTDGVNVFPEVYAAAAGVVLYAGDSRDLGWPNQWYFNPDFDRTDAWDSSAGNILVVGHVQNGVPFVTTYSHLESWNVRQGDPVAPRQRIAITGNTGNSYGKHLHFELLFKPFNFATATYGRADPNPYLSGTIQPAGDDITPVQEDDMAQVPQKEWEEIRNLVRELAAKPAPQQLVILKRPGSPTCYIAQGMEYREIKSLDTLYNIQWLSRAGIMSVYRNGQVQIIDDVYALGIDAYAKVKK